MRGKGGWVTKKSEASIFIRSPRPFTFSWGSIVALAINERENPSAKSLRSSGEERDCRSARPLLVFMDEQFKAPPEGPMTTEDQ